MDNGGSIWILAYLKPLVGINYLTLIFILYIWVIIAETDFIIAELLRTKNT